MEYNKNTLVIQLKRENQVLLNVLNYQNEQLEELALLKNHFVQKINIIQNMQQAFYVITNALSEAGNKSLTNNDINELMNLILDATAFGLLNKPVEDGFDKQDILKGRLAALKYIEEDCNCSVCQKKSEESQEYTNIKFNEIDNSNDNVTKIFFQAIKDNKNTFH